MRTTAASIGFILLVSGITAQNSARPTAEQILHNRALWGKDFRLVLSQIPSWNAVGEQQIEVLPTRVVGRKSYSKTKSELVVSKLSQALHAHQTQALVAVDDWLHTRQSNATEAQFSQPLRMEKVMESPLEKREDSVRVQVSSGDSLPQFLNPELTESDLNRELGAPDEISLKRPDMSDPNKYEGRPEIVKVYSYAGGTIQFEVSNLSPYAPGKNARLIEKAIIDTSHTESVLPPAAK
jgi:hypothetical protein